MIDMRKDPLEVLKGIKAKDEGVPIEKIEFRNLRKKNKKTVESESFSDKITNDEGFDVIQNDKDFIGYGEIRKKRRHIKPKNSLEDWGAFDFFEYAHKLYIDKYGMYWNLKAGGNSLEINKIRDNISDSFGFCSNLIMRDYIIYFFNNHIDFFKNNYKEFYFKQMNSENIIKSFLDKYNYKERFIEYIKNEKSKNKQDITLKEIKDSFLLGDTTLVSNYGIVISLNWLIQKHKMTKKKAALLVVNACKEMYQKGMISVIIKSTEFYSPYPSNIIFKNPQVVLNKIDKNIKIDVEFNDNDRILFLQKGKK